MRVSVRVWRVVRECWRTLICASRQAMDLFASSWHWRRIDVAVDRSMMHQDSLSLLLKQRKMNIVAVWSVSTAVRREADGGRSAAVLVDGGEGVGDVLTVTSWAACGIWSTEQVVKVTGRKLAVDDVVIVDDKNFVGSSLWARASCMLADVCDGMTIWTFFGSPSVAACVELIVIGFDRALIELVLFVVVNLTNFTGLWLPKPDCCDCWWWLCIDEDDVTVECGRCCVMLEGETRMILVLPIWIFVVGLGTTVWKLMIRGATNSVDVPVPERDVEDAADVVGWMINWGWCRCCCCCVFIGDVCWLDVRASFSFDENKISSGRVWSDLPITDGGDEPMGWNFRVDGF